MQNGMQQINLVVSLDKDTSMVKMRVTHKADSWSNRMVTTEKHDIESLHPRFELFFAQTIELGHIFYRFLFKYEALTSPDVFFQVFEYGLALLAGFCLELERLVRALQSQVELCLVSRHGQNVHLYEVHVDYAYWLPRILRSIPFELAVDHPDEYLLPTAKARLLLDQ